VPLPRLPRLSLPRHSAVHRWLAILWMVPGLAVAWYITYRVEEPHALFMVLVISLWANTASHWSAYEAAKGKEQGEDTAS
jgi:hypothetical protein